MESTYCASSLIPSCACFILLLPSKAKGVVTTATVRMPRSLAILATTGAAPVPVPPPIPAVMNTISAPVSTSVRASLLSSAARVPTSGLAPAPIPFVAFSPIRILCVAVDFARAGLSEFTATNSTS